MGVWDVMRSQNTQLKNPSVPNGGLYWYIIGRPNGVKKRAWFSTRAKAQAEATERNIKLRRLGQDSAKVDNSIIVMAVEGATELAPKTRMKIFGYIRNAYGIAVQKGLLEMHPFEKVENFMRSKKSEAPAFPLTPEEATKSAALEAAGSGVRVNVVAPGPIETGMLNRFTGTNERKAGLVGGVPLKRTGRPEEIAQTIVFLSSDKAPFITGASFAVDGGRTAQ
jgi:hypothetical protein